MCPFNQAFGRDIWGMAVNRQCFGLGCGCPPAYTPVSRLEDINKSCLEQFRTHWQCLENNNQQLWQCRPDEWKLNKCVFEKLVRWPPLLITGMR